MDAITLPYHLVIPSALSFIFLLMIFVYRKRLFTDRKLLWSCLTLFLVLYLIIVGGAACESVYSQWDLCKYDLNKDGFFSGEELTKDQKAAMQNLTKDTARNFSFVTGLVFSFIISMVAYIVGHTISRIKNTLNN